MSAVETTHAESLCIRHTKTKFDCKLFQKGAYKLKLINWPFSLRIDVDRCRSPE